MSKFKLSLFILSTVWVFSPAFSAAIKPRPPIQLMFQERALSETEVEITLTARVGIDSDTVSLSIMLPPELFLIEGEAEWEGPMSAGSEQKITVVVLSSGIDGPEIEGRASIRFPGAAVFEQRNRMVLKQSQLSTPESKPTPPIKRKGNQEAVIEFR